MKYLKFENVPWHWQLAHVYGPLYDNGGKTQTFNMCQYARAVLIGAFVALCVMAAGGIVVSFIGSTVAWGAAMAVNASFIEPTVMTRIAVLIGVVLIIVWLLAMIDRVVIYQAGKIIKNRAAPQFRSTTEPGFIKQWYKSFKDKTCVDITIHKNPQ